MTRHARTLLTTCAVLLAACDVSGARDPTTVPNGGSGARLTIDYDLDTDVVGFHFEVERVACYAGETFERFYYEENVALDTMTFPGNVQFLGDDPFDSYSEHQGADFFVALDAGCYVVTAAPASELSEESWTPSEECSVAESDLLEVVDGYTTEAVLISQCEGELVGGLDSLVLLNQPPLVIPDIDNKFNTQCEPVTICATAWDPNDDPMEIVFENVAGPDWFSIETTDLTAIAYEDGHKVYETCATIVTEDIADYMVELRAYDLAYDEHGAEVRIEDLIGQDSHGWVQVPIHTGWNVSDSCIDETGAVETACPTECTVIGDEEYLCSGDYDVDPDLVSLVCDGTDLLEEVLYPMCE